MIDHLRYDGTGSLVGEYFELTATQLQYDTVGMWEMVPAGRQAYGLSGADLDEFLRRFIIALMARGAKPVRVVVIRPGYWAFVEQTQYGTSPLEIANASVADWHSSGNPNPEWDWVKFARPEIIGIPTPDHAAVTPGTGGASS